MLIVEGRAHTTASLEEGTQLDLEAKKDVMPFAQFDVRTPKRRATSSSRAEESYPYYAGYAESFARDALQRLSEPGSVVYDPWNGAGTTTHAAASMGRRAYGSDLNPVMVVVARAKCASPAEIAEARSKLREVSLPRGRSRSESDPLAPWVGAAAALYLRRLVQSALPLNVSADASDQLNNIAAAVSEAGPGMCFLVLAIFRAVKAGAASTASSNPTWTKQPTQPENWNTVKEWREFIDAQFSRLAEINLEMSKSWPVDSELINIACGSSECISLPDSYVDVVLTSPPYCTRIDYAVATLVELAVLGLSTSTVNATLRKELLGTTSIRADVASIADGWGPTCAELLHSVYHHRSSGSRSYYFKNFVQYFDALYRSLEELSRIVKAGGVMCSVLQGSHYKECPIDLPRIFEEMAHSRGFSTMGIASFNVVQNMGSINRKSLIYRKPVQLTEKVLVFKREK